MLIRLSFYIRKDSIFRKLPRPFSYCEKMNEGRRGGKTLKRLRPLEHIAIYKDRQYNTFPSVARRRDGGIVLGFRQAPDRRASYGGHQHIDPSSKAVALLSVDGRAWSESPDVMFDHFTSGVQDPCLNLLRDGTIVGTFFMWKVFEKDDLPEQPGDRTVYQDWQARMAGAYTVRSADGGRTWDQPIRISIPDVAIRGTGVELDNGALLVPMYRSGAEGFDALAAITDDKGKTWRIHSVIASRDGRDFLEPFFYKTPSGKIVALLRTRLQGAGAAGRDTNPLYTCESLDNGLTWSVPTPRPFHSPSPFHLLALDDGTALMTYGYRHKPYGIRAVLLDSECERWDEADEIVLREDGGGIDIGYTSSVRLDERTVLVTYYYFDEDGYRYIAGTLCEWSP